MNATLEASAPPFESSTAWNGEDSLYELIDGRKVEHPMSLLAIRVTCMLFGRIFTYLLQHPVGEALQEALLQLTDDPRRQRRPDVIFVSNERIQASPPQDGSVAAWKIVPELMVEVVSPSNLAEEVMEKVVEYFAAGCKLVWIIYPTLQAVYVYSSPSKVQVLGPADMLGGGDVLPGFEVSVASLFPTAAAR